MQAEAEAEAGKAGRVGGTLNASGFLLIECTVKHGG